MGPRFPCDGGGAQAAVDGASSVVVHIRSLHMRYPNGVYAVKGLSMQVWWRGAFMLPQVALLVLTKVRSHLVFLAQCA
jgi:hypothetical protein